MSERVFYSHGCLGDLIAALPIIRHLGGGHIRIGNYKEQRNAHRRMEGAKFESIRSLLAAQPYVQSVEFQDNAPFTHDLANWRGGHSVCRTLTESQAAHLEVTESIDMSPWLSGIVPNNAMAGRIAIARTCRYQNPEFPWQSIVAREWRRMAFLGSPEEHIAFMEAFQRPVEHVATADMLEAAQAIAGSDMLISNQTAACWIGIGIGHPLIQEVCPSIHDSIVPRENARYPMSEFDFRKLAAEFACIDSNDALSNVP